MQTKFSKLLTGNAILSREGADDNSPAVEIELDDLPNGVAVIPTEEP